MIQAVIHHIINTIHAAIRRYGAEGKMEAYYGSNEEEDTLGKDQELRQKLYAGAAEDYPRIYQTEYPVFYGAVRSGEKVYILGPVSTDYTNYNEEQRISYCDFMEFVNEVLLLHNVLNGQDMGSSDVIARNFETLDMKQKVEKKLGQIYFRYQESGKVHNPYDQEVRELNSIREGNVEHLIHCMDEVIEGEYAVLSREPLQSLKNLAIVTLATSARAAIDGGMLPEESFSMNDVYILQVDAAVNAGQIGALVRRAKIEYAKIVGDIGRQKQKVNTLVEEAKKIIYRDMHKKIIVKEIAGEMHITPEYLSALFRRSENITVNDYIMKTKVQQTENLLIYSGYSIEEIGYYFGFCSQSHYGRVFKKWKGTTPGKFREQYGKKEFIRKFRKEFEEKKY